MIDPKLTPPIQWSKVVIVISGVPIQEVYPFPITETIDVEFEVVEPKKNSR